MRAVVNKATHLAGIRRKLGQQGIVGYVDDPNELLNSGCRF